MSTRAVIAGPSGALEIALDTPQALPPRALALVCHPNPTQGGTMDNKVVTSVSKALTDLGFAVCRFNYRGVGQSAGTWDDGVGEIEDALCALNHLKSTFGADLPISIAGFSFGGFIAARVGQQSAPKVHLGEKLLLIAPAVGRFVVADVPPDTRVLQGEADDVVTLADVLAWARPLPLPVTVLPGAGHFFHGQLVTLKHWVKAQWPA